MTAPDRASWLDIAGRIRCAVEQNQHIPVPVVIGRRRALFSIYEYEHDTASRRMAETEAVMSAVLGADFADAGVEDGLFIREAVLPSGYTVHVKARAVLVAEKQVTGRQKVSGPDGPAYVEEYTWVRRPLPDPQGEGT